MTQDHERRLTRLEELALLGPWHEESPRKDAIMRSIEAERAARVQQAEGASTPWECKARKAGSAGGHTPLDCDWPHCGCDPHADKVLEALDEEGWSTPNQTSDLLAEISRLRAIEEAARLWLIPLREKHRLQAEDPANHRWQHLAIVKSDLRDFSLKLAAVLEGAPAQPPAPAGTREAAPDFEAAKPRIDILALLYQARTHLQFVTTYMGTRKAHEELEIVDAQLVKAAELFCAYTAARQGTVPEWAGIGGIKGTSQEVQDVLGDLVEAHADDCFYTSGLNDGYGDESCSCALQSTIVYLRCLQRAFEARDTAARQSPPEPVSVERIRAAVHAALFGSEWDGPWCKVAMPLRNFLTCDIGLEELEASIREAGLKLNVRPAPAPQTGGSDNPGKPERA